MLRRDHTPSETPPIQTTMPLTIRPRFLHYINSGLAWISVKPFADTDTKGIPAFRRRTFFKSYIRVGTGTSSDFLMNFTKAVPRSSFLLRNVSFAKDLRPAASMGVVAASMGIFSNPLPCGASDEAGFLAAGGCLRAVLPQPGKAATPLRACIQLFSAAALHVAPIAAASSLMASRSLERFLRRAQCEANAVDAVSEDAIAWSLDKNSDSSGRRSPAL